MDVFRKDCSSNEIRLQTIAAEMGLAPQIRETDNETYMVMDKLPAMNIGDMYGTSIRTLPHYVRNGIVDTLRTLYETKGIQFVDITPYNFIEYGKRIWIIDFGDAYDDQEEVHPHLNRILTSGLLRWNPEFK
jgi:tRNA A-37 threonylcarbamoyl transferase component Bud32